ncbi:hypothetical protein I4F81_005364 [Pyropia yezoensis]|uniref:Uncharacterized protein n=1 Tax=Pyropia yezoensis TaxID=2788 RepID=A0ACC3BZ40_PYRYE|nr:hypothetical protein I4F81_005364 [Neopyropia yezoensis]
MAAALRAAVPPGTPVSVVPLTRRTWAATLGGRPVTPVLAALDGAIDEAAAASADGRVNLEWLAKLSYELTAGVPVRDGAGGGVGDGIVPLEVAGLAGARNVVLEGVVHSPRAGADTWYGGEAAVRYWSRFLL